MPVYRNEILAGSQSQKNNANIIEKSLKLDNAAGGATGLTRNLSGANRKTFTVSLF